MINDSFVYYFVGINIIIWTNQNVSVPSLNNRVILWYRDHDTIATHHAAIK